MTAYAIPRPVPRPETAPNTAWLVSSGDLREGPNLAGWPQQRQMEQDLAASFARFGWTITRANPIDPASGHGFVSSQRMGLDVFTGIPADAPLIVAEAVWQYSHHLLAGLRTHRGPILTVANFDGGAPGLVGLLALNASMTKMGVPYSTIWSIDFTDEWYYAGLEQWIASGTISHDQTHVRELGPLPGGDQVELGLAVATQLRQDKALFGVFDEGCMGMYHAIIDDELMNPLGIYKERLSQSALWAEMTRTPDSEASAVLDWLVEKGMRFDFGTDEATELTENQVLLQAKMYISILRISDQFGLDAVGIQYQQGLKDICPASDLAEGLINNSERPPVMSHDGTRELWAGTALPLANEADEGAGVDALITHRIWSAMGLNPDTTLHDVRWGEEFDGQFVWVFEISGAVPPSHFAEGFAGARGLRQNPMYFPLGGSTVTGISRPGELVWSRLFIENGSLHLDIGRGSVVDLPIEETRRRMQATSPEWPIANVVLHGVSRDQLMARHKANHVQIAYAADAAEADRALTAKAAAFDALGVTVHLIGDARLV